MRKNEIDKHWDCNIDQQAEREALALRKQGRDCRYNAKRLRQRDNYNAETFNRLFRSK